MDPKAALRDLLQANLDQDKPAAMNAALALAGWWSKGGFLLPPADLAEVCALFVGPGDPP